MFSSPCHFDTSTLLWACFLLGTGRGFKHPHPHPHPACNFFNILIHVCTGEILQTIGRFTHASRSQWKFMRNTVGFPVSIRPQFDSHLFIILLDGLKQAAASASDPSPAIWGIIILVYITEQKLQITIVKSIERLRSTLQKWLLIHTVFLLFNHNSIECVILNVWNDSSTKPSLWSDIRSSSFVYWLHLLHHLFITLAAYPLYSS